MLTGVVMDLNINYKIIDLLNPTL